MYYVRVYFDVFRQSSRFNFRRSQQRSFYVFRVFVNGRGGSILTYVDKVCVVICDHQNRVPSMWGDDSYAIYSPTIYPFRLSRHIEPYIPRPFTVLGRYSLSIYHYSIGGGETAYKRPLGSCIGKRSFNL